MVADAGMLSAGNLNALEDAGFSFIVGSRMAKAPYDLADHFERHGTFFEDGQILESADQRLHYYKRGLQHDASLLDVKRYLREHHADVLPEGLFSEDDPN